MQYLANVSGAMKKLADKYPKKEYYLFSKTGFTDECQKLAKDVGYHLTVFEEM